MLNLAEDRRRPALLALTGRPGRPGRAWGRAQQGRPSSARRASGPDLDTAPHRVSSLRPARLNNALSAPGSAGAVVEAERHEAAATDGPVSRASVLALVDEECAPPRGGGAIPEAGTTYVNLPPRRRVLTCGKPAHPAPQGQARGRERLALVAETDRFLQLLDGAVPEPTRLSPTARRHLPTARRPPAPRQLG